LNIEQAVDFRHSEPTRLPIPDGFAEVAVSIFDFHRHSAEQFLAEAARTLAPEGHLVLAEVLEPKSTLNRWIWNCKKLHLKYVQKNPAEALGSYYDREEIIGLLFAAGFRQVIIQGLASPRSLHSGVFSLVAATK
jgi:ubiquinone/menaquinone biosynthesis C-methylase UbiE